MIPHLVERAMSLAGHVKRLGAPLDQFTVPATPQEAFEALDWLRAEWESTGQDMDYGLLDKDIAEARRRGNPWFVLEHFEVCGMKVVPRKDLH